MKTFVCKLNINQTVWLLISFWALFPGLTISQISLDALLSNAKANHPIMESVDLKTKESNLEIKNANALYYPGISFSGQATYQSEVTSIDIPFQGIEIPQPEKDQYKLIAEVNQLLYDGGLTKRKKSLLRDKAAIEQTTILLDWQQLKKTIIELYFSTLELDARLSIVQNTRENLEKGIKTIESGVDIGVALSSQAMEMKAGLLSLIQIQIELEALHEQLIEQLSILSYTDISDNFVLERPEEMAANIEIGKGLKFTLLEQQQKLIYDQFRLENTSFQPKLAAFFQAGYGSPGLNFLDSDFSDFYITGVRMQWNIQKLYTQNKDKQIMNLRQMQLDQRSSSLSLQQKVQNTAHDHQISKLQQQIDLDKELVELRNQISETAKVQLEQGIINTTEFLIQINEERSAQETLQIHEIQLIKTQYLKAHDNE